MPMEPTVKNFLTILTGHVTQHDIAVSKRERRPNIYRLGILLGAVERVEQEMRHWLDSSDPADLDYLARSIRGNFEEDFPPRQKILKAIEDYLTTGKQPKYPVSKETKMGATRRSFADKTGTAWDATRRYGPYEVAIRWTGEESDGKDVYEYALWDHEWEDGKKIFHGHDFASPAMAGYTDDWKIANLLGFLSLKEGDTDDEYFKNYTEDQLTWRDARAEDLSIYQQEAEEKAAKKMRTRRP